MKMEDKKKCEQRSSLKIKRLLKKCFSENAPECTEISKGLIENLTS